MQHIYYFCVMVEPIHATRCVMSNKSITTQIFKICSTIRYCQTEFWPMIKHDRNIKQQNSVSVEFMFHPMIRFREDLLSSISNDKPNP